MIATGAGQTRATTRAHDHALDLFKEQTEEHLRLAHLEHKRDLYARLLNLMDEYRTASRRLVEATKAASNVSADAQDELQDELEDAPPDASQEDSSIRELEAATGAAEALAPPLHAAVVSVQLVAPKNVRDAALAFLDAVREETNDPDAKELPTFRWRVRGWKAREHYVDEVRKDLGVAR